MLPTRPFFVQLAVWTTYALLRIVAALPAVPDRARGAMAMADIVRAATGLLLTSLAWPALRRWVNPVSRSGWLVASICAIVVSFAWTVVDRVVLVTLAALTGVAVPWEYFPHGVDLGYGIVLIAWTTAALFVLLLQHEAKLRESLLTQEAAAHRARLIALTNRLNPHFLFNSLNTIRAFAGENPERTREMLTRLSTFLRHSLSFEPTREAPLAAELDSVESYLWIEQARFEPKLVVEYNINEETRPLLVPPLILQPLIENAVRHGEAGADGLHRIRVTVARTRDGLRLSVSNTGELTMPTVEGVGLSLTRERLAQSYGRGQRLTYAAKDGWVTVTIEIDNIGKAAAHA